MTQSDIASVYRNLETLGELGLVRHFHAGHGPGRYVLEGFGDREYLACESCGVLESVEPAALDSVRDAVRDLSGFEASFSHFPIVGLCARCAQRRPRSAASSPRPPRIVNRIRRPATQQPVHAPSQEDNAIVTCAGDRIATLGQPQRPPSGDSGNGDRRTLKPRRRQPPDTADSGRPRSRSARAARGRLLVDPGLGEAALRGRSIQPGGRLRRSAARRRRAVDAAGARPAASRRRHARAQGRRSRCEVATDEGLRRVVRKGTRSPRPSSPTRCTSSVEGLDPAREYFYRFNAGSDESPIGRTLTAPGRPEPTSPSCSSPSSPARTSRPATSRPTATSPTRTSTLVVHLGDYIYEGAAAERHRPRARAGRARSSRWPTTAPATGSTRATRTCRPPTRATPSSSPGTTTRSRTTTPARSPRTTSDPQRVPAPAADAYQAYYEHQPLRLSAKPRGPDMRLYRRLTLRSPGRVQRARHPPVPRRPGAARPSARRRSGR